MSHRLELQGVSAFYGAAQALYDLDLAIAPGTVTVLRGPNGAGKTTVLRAICQQVTTRGAILLDGRPLQGCRTEAIARQGIVHVPEGRGGFASLSVEDNLRLGAWHRALPRTRLKHALAAVYQRFPILRERRRQQAGTLSGGEQQMLAIGRALLAQPRILLLDEPCLGLAPETADHVLRGLHAINQSDGLSMLWVEQHGDIEYPMAHQVAVLGQGRICHPAARQGCDAQPAPFTPTHRR
jgi:branched-chain amino acid transport system ATP-binding protein